MLFCDVSFSALLSFRALRSCSFVITPRSACPHHHHHHTHIPFASHICMCLFLICFNLLCACTHPFTKTSTPLPPKVYPPTSSPNSALSFLHPKPSDQKLFPPLSYLPPTAFAPVFLFHHDFLLGWSEVLLSPGCCDAPELMVSFAHFPACNRPYMCQALLNIKQADYCTRCPLFEKPRKNVEFSCCQKMQNFQPTPAERWEEPCCVLTVISYTKQCLIDSGIVW